MSIEWPSGKFVVRLPVDLHRELVDQAGRENVSLNQLVTAYLASAAGWPRATKRARAVVAAGDMTRPD
jgi:HicB family